MSATSTRCGPDSNPRTAAGADTTRGEDLARLGRWYGRSVTAAIQLRGGIGSTWEADRHWLYKRPQVDAAYLVGPLQPRIYNLRDW